MTERLIDRAFDSVERRGSEQLVFCVAFAILEYAIKKRERVQERNGRAFPNWTLIERRQPDLTAGASPKTTAAIRYVLDHPPEVQYAVDGRAEFGEKALEGTENQRISEALRRIRNNLFHGGKLPYGARDKRLVNEGLEIIERYFEVYSDLRDAASSMI